MYLDRVRSSFEDASVHYLEPLVVIGRDGETQVSEGIHRAATAEDDSPSDPAEYRDHPDLAALV